MRNRYFSPPFWGGIGLLVLVFFLSNLPALSQKGKLVATTMLGIFLFLLPLVSVYSYDAESPSEELLAELVPIEPILECVEDLGDGRFKATFGYNNPNESVVTVPRGNSRVVWNGTSRQEKVFNVFQPGSHESVLEVEFDTNGIENGLTWIVRIPKKASMEDSADASSPLCVISDIIPLCDAEAEGGLLWPEAFCLATNPQTESNEIYQIQNGDVLIEIAATEVSVVNQLRTLLISLGFNNEIPNGSNQLLITGFFPISNLLQLNDNPDKIRFVRAVPPPLINSGLVDSQGDRSQTSDIAREAFNLLGENVIISILSDSYDRLGGSINDVNNGDLPGSEKSGNLTPVEVVQELPAPFLGGTDEGRAMAQIVHDVAPGAFIKFRTGVLSEHDFAAGIRQLAAPPYNSDIIVDDITWTSAPYFQDGPAAQAVNDVTSQGVHVFTSAGNFGQLSHQDEWTEASQILNLPFITDNQARAHDFSGSGDITHGATWGPGVYVIVMQWEDKFHSLGQVPGAEFDLDIWIVDDALNLLYEANRFNIGEDPVEILSFNATTARNANILITGSNIPAGLRFKYILFRVPIVNGLPDFQFDEYNTGTSTIVGHANAELSNTTGALLYSNSPAFGNVPSTASFSSQGGTPVNGTVRNQPTFVTANGVNTTVDLGGLDLEGDGFPNFFGTSAAAPHAAAVAGLILEGLDRFHDISSGPIKDEISPLGLTGLLQTTAIDMDTPGFDFSSGAGLIQANAALSSIANPSPQILQLIIPEGITPGSEEFTLTVEGKYLTDDAQILFRGEPLVTTDIRDINETTSQIDAVVNNFVGNPAMQISNPPLPGTNGLDGGISNSLFFFSTEKTTVTIKADNKDKKFGEILPEFTFGTSPALSPVELALLPEIEFVTLATPTSDVGFYFIQPQFVIDPETGEPPEIPAGLQELYDLQLADGALRVDALPVMITPNDIIITYGDPVLGITMNYDIGDSLEIADEEQLLQNISAEHQSQILEDTIAILNRGLALVNRGLALVNGTAWSITEASLNRGLALVNGNVMVEIDSTILADLQENPTGTFLNRGLALVNAGALVNGTAVVNNRGLALVNRGLALVNSNTVNGSSNSQVVVIVDENDEFIESIFSLNFVTGIDATVPGNEQLIIPAAFYNKNLAVVSYGFGNMTVLPATLTGTVQPVTITYGEAIPEFNTEFDGFVLGETEEEIIGEDGVIYDVNPDIDGAGVYTVTGSLAEALSNYTVNWIDAQLSIEKAPLTIAANDMVIDEGEVFNPTSAVLGFVNGDTFESVFTEDITYSISPVFNGDPGIYTSTPSIAEPQNYQLSLFSGTLYVNPDGPGTRKVKVFTDCIQRIQGDPSGFDFKAFFRYDNPNNDAIYKPIGPENFFSGDAIFSGLQPELFLPGVHQFEILFDGNTLKWTLITLDVNQKVATSSEASSSSGRCKKVNGKKVSSEEAEEEFTLFPNPTTNIVTIQVNDPIISAEIESGYQVVVFDINGSPIQVSSNWDSSALRLEIDVSAQAPGLYFIKLLYGNTSKTFTVLKE